MTAEQSFSSGHNNLLLLEVSETCTTGYYVFSSLEDKSDPMSS